jgi:hypothetical protein
MANNKYFNKDHTDPSSIAELQQEICDPIGAHFQFHL